MTVTRLHSTTAGISYIVYGTITLTVSDNYTTAVGGGITLNFNQSNVKATRTPIWVDIQGSAGYTYAYVPGTNASNGKIVIRQEGTAGGAASEISTGTIPAGIAN